MSTAIPVDPFVHLTEIVLVPERGALALAPMGSYAPKARSGEAVTVHVCETVAVTFMFAVAWPAHAVLPMAQAVNPISAAAVFINADLRYDLMVISN
jgi:putative aminopeptidase FrvX